MAMRCRTAILISGSGTNLQAFIDRVATGALDIELSVVLSNRADAFGLERARKAGIPTACIAHGQFSDRASFDHAMAEKLDEWQPDLLVLAGFMRILGAGFVEIECGGKTIVFSGDVGRYEVPLHRDPDPMPACDVLVIESTYGDREHDHEPVADQIRRVFKEAIRRKGVVLIPAFAAVVSITIGWTSSERRRCRWDRHRDHRHQGGRV